MIYVTGDIHGHPQRFNLGRFPEMETMNKNDYIIICGDFGLVLNPNEPSVYEDEWLNWLNEKPFTTLFIDGNHENFDRLNNYPIELWHGGKVHKIRSSVIHLMRGQMFNLNGFKFFAFGGAKSHDVRDGILSPIKDAELIEKWERDPGKFFRINHVSWWKEEMPSNEEMNEGIATLNEKKWKCDYVLTHSPDTGVLSKFTARTFPPDRLCDYLFDIRQNLDYKEWYFGHMHVNQAFKEEKMRCIYDDIIRIV